METIGQPDSEVPTKPAHWATVWDTLGYTDTGFIGDYLATDLGVTGMDYEIFLNHSVPDKTWNVYLQENHINAHARHHQDGDGVRAVPGEGVQQPQRATPDRGPRRLRVQRAPRHRPDKQRCGNASRSRRKAASEPTARRSTSGPTRPRT